MYKKEFFFGVILLVMNVVVVFVLGFFVNWDVVLYMMFLIFVIGKVVDVIYICYIKFILIIIMRKGEEMK